MSDKARKPVTFSHIAKPRHVFCWVCSGKLVATKVHRVAIGADGHEHPCHIQCAEEEGLQIVEGAHLK